MKNIFLLGFTGGSCGDFLCSKISKDDNFYTLESSMTSDMNRCELENPLLPFGINIKNPVSLDSLNINSEDYKNIDIKFSQKNLILPIHYFANINNIKLPRLAGVKLCSSKLTPLFYILLWIKRWKNKVPIMENEHTLIDCAGNNLTLIKQCEEMIKRGYYYSFEQTALRSNMYNSINLPTMYFPTYRNLSSKVDIGWTSYNIDNLFLNTKENITGFSQLFNMSGTLNADDIIQYHAANLELVEKHFNKSYFDLMAGNWLVELQTWIEEQCPDSYKID
jgi:hypothetical protein